MKSIIYIKNSFKIIIWKCYFNTRSKKLKFLYNTVAESQKNTGILLKVQILHVLHHRINHLNGHLKNNRKDLQHGAFVSKAACV